LSLWFEATIEEGLSKRVNGLTTDREGVQSSENQQDRTDTQPVFMSLSTPYAPLFYVGCNRNQSQTANL